MRYVVALGLLMVSLSGGNSLYAQLRSGGLGGGQTMPTGGPPGPSGKVSSHPTQPEDTPPPETVKLKRRFDAHTARKNAQQMAELAGKIPGEIDLLSKNLLPRDLARQLKEIEKLAKSLRSQINP